MKILRLFTICSFAFLGACSKKDSGAAVVDRHADAIQEFQGAQQHFKDTVATVRDEASYDKAAPDLDQVIQHFRRSAVLMKDLSPPDEAARARYRKMIADGHRKTEPTGEDMMSILTIESREKEVTAWMEAFVAAGQEAGVEMKRLFGEIDYGKDAEEQIQLEPKAEQAAPSDADKPSN